MKSVFFFVLTIFFLALSVSSLAQSTKEFKIKVQMDGERMILECTEGCAWTNLEFNLEEGGKPQFINEYGMAMKDEPQRSHEDMPSFLFSMRRQQTKVFCNSKYGTNWVKLDFSCNPMKCSATLSEKGVKAK